VVELWRALGAVPVEISPGAHDEMLAWTSHLPQLAATALANALAGAGHPPGRLGPGGRDATRLAGSSPAVWRAICLDNADLIVPALRALEAEIATLRSALESGDEPALAGRFARGQRWSTTSGE
jgi:prephenate dehydrogenase